MPGTELDYSELPLKRLKLGPPDIYRQEVKQKEDELSTASIREGFKCHPVVPDEYALARDLSSISAHKRESSAPSSRGLSMQTIGMSLSAIVTRKAELCALPDTSRRRLQLNKEHFFMVHQKTRQAADSWLADLSGAEPLSRLIRTIPIFNKREDIFAVLCDHTVPPGRAIWYIKLVNYYNSNISTSDVARRPMGGGPVPSSGMRPMKGPSDPCNDWTQVISRFLQDLLDKIDAEFAGTGLTARDTNVGVNQPTKASGPLQQSSQSGAIIVSGISRFNAPGNTNPGVGNISVNPQNSSEPASSSKNDIELWQYTTRLCNVLYQERMLDPHELMSWMIELIHKSNFQHDNTLRLVIVLITNYLEVFASSHFLTRRLAYVCCLLIKRFHASAERQQQASAGSQNQSTTHCTRHRLIFAGISNILQYLLVANPQSFVWNDLGDIFNSKRPNSMCPVLYGSPLDDLPCLPSSLPVSGGSGGENRIMLLQKFFNPSHNGISLEERLRRCIADAERCVVTRSKAYEMFRDPLGILATISPSALISRRVAELLVRLDRHNFSSNVGSSSLSHLYSFIPPLRWRHSSTSHQSTLQFVPRHLRSKNPLVDAEHCATVAHLLLWAVLPQADSNTAGEEEYRWFVATRLLASVRSTSILQLKDLVAGNGPNSSAKTPDEDTTPNLMLANGSNSDPTLIAAEQCVDEVFQEELFDFIGSKLIPLIVNEAQLGQKVSSLNGECGSSVAGLILRNAVHLFGELVENGLFSPTAFMSALVARGYLPNLNQNGSQNAKAAPNSGSKQPLPGGISSPQSVHQPSAQTPLSVTSWPNSAGPASLRTPTKLDSVKEVDSSSSLMSPNNVKPEHGATKANSETNGDLNGSGVVSLLEMIQKNAQNGADASSDYSISDSISNAYHLFLLHFPFPDNRSASMAAGSNSHIDSATRRDEENQRGILLFGVGQKRQSVSKAVRKSVRELQRWFSKRSCVDIFTGQSVSTKSSKKAGKNGSEARIALNCTFQPAQQAQLRLWSSDVSWHDRMAVLESVANNDALAALRQIVDVVMAAGPSATKAALAESIPPVPGLSSIFKLADLLLRAQTVRPAFHFASCILRSCPAILMLGNIHQQISPGSDRFAQHYANELLILGVSICRRFFMCLLAAPDLCISASYALLNVIISYIVSPQALLFHNKDGLSKGAAMTTVSGQSAMQLDAFNLSMDAASPSSSNLVRFPGSALKIALLLIRELHSNSSDVQGWLNHNREFYSSFSPVAKQVIEIITSDRLLPPLNSEPPSMSCLTASLDQALFVDVIRNQAMSPPYALATLFPLPQPDPSEPSSPLTPCTFIFPLQEMLKSDANRYSLVVNSLCAIVEPQASIDYAVEMGAMLADICTMACPKLADDLLGALGVLCGAAAAAAAQSNSSNSSANRLGSSQSFARSNSLSASSISSAFIDLRLSAGPSLQSDSRTADSARANIANLVSVLLARSILNFSDLIRFILVPVLVQAKMPSTSSQTSTTSSSIFPGNPMEDREEMEEELESGIYLVYAILRTVVNLAEMGLVGSYPTPAMDAKGSIRTVGEAYAQAEATKNLIPIGLNIADILLLHAQISNTEPNSFLQIIKTLMSLGDVACPQAPVATTKSGVSIQTARSNQIGDPAVASDIFYAYATSPVVRSRLLAEPDQLFSPSMLLDSAMTKDQQRHLVDCLCCTGEDGSSRVSAAADPRQRSTLVSILSPLTASSLRRTRLRIQLVYRQVSSTELQQFLDNLGSVVMDMFSASSKTWRQQNVEGDLNFPERLWFIAPLTASLIECMQSRVLREAWRLLDSAVPPAHSLGKLKEKDRDRLLDTMALVAHPAFVTLVATLVATRRDQADELAKVLYGQLEKLIQYSFAASGVIPQSDGANWDDATLRHEALRLRLALVGSVLDSGILRQTSSATDWAVVCCQLLTHQVGAAPCDAKNTQQALLFDLLTCFIHATMTGTDSFTERDENKKAYITAVKKLRKDIGECQSPVARDIRRLMPLSRHFFEAPVMEPYGAIIDSRGNQITGLSANARQQGLQIAGVHMLNPWEIIEAGSGWRNSGPISWTWFCARRLDVRPSARFCRLGVLAAYHQPLKSSDASFLEPLPPRPKHADSESSSDDSEPESPIPATEVSKNKADKSKQSFANETSVHEMSGIVASQPSSQPRQPSALASMLSDPTVGATPLAAALMDSNLTSSRMEDDIFLLAAQQITPQHQQMPGRQRNSSEKHKMPPPPVALPFDTRESFSDLPSATLMMEQNPFGAPMHPQQAGMMQPHDVQQQQQQTMMQQQGPPPPGGRRSRQRRSGEGAPPPAPMQAPPQPGMVPVMDQNQTGYQVATPRPPQQMHGSAQKQAPPQGGPQGWNQQPDVIIHQPHPNILEQQQQLHQQQQQRMGPTGAIIAPGPQAMATSRNASSLHDLLSSSQVAPAVPQPVAQMDQRMMQQHQQQQQQQQQQQHLGPGPMDQDPMFAQQVGYPNQAMVPQQQRTVPNQSHQESGLSRLLQSPNQQPPPQQMQPQQQVQDPHFMAQYQQQSQMRPQGYPPQQQVYHDPMMQQRMQQGMMRAPVPGPQGQPMMQQVAPGMVVKGATQAPQMMGPQGGGYMQQQQAPPMRPQHAPQPGQYYAPPGQQMPQQYGMPPMQQQMMGQQPRLQMPPQQAQMMNRPPGYPPQGPYG